VRDELAGQVDERSVVRRHSRQGQHDNMNGQVHEGAVSEAAKNGSANQECEFAAGEIIDRCRTERDNEMQDHSRGGGSSPSAIRFQSENAADNSFRKQNRLARTVHGNRVEKIQYAVQLDHRELSERI
jgi:hypothetical protein